VTIFARREDCPDRGLSGRRTKEDTIGREFLDGNPITVEGCAYAAAWIALHVGAVALGIFVILCLTAQRR